MCIDRDRHFSLIGLVLIYRQSLWLPNNCFRLGSHIATATIGGNWQLATGNWQTAALQNPLECLLGLSLSLSLITAIKMH